MEQSWDFEFLSRIADSCMAFLSEFVDDWLANDMRVVIFKILLGWLIFSLVAIHFAWKVYGTTVNDMYYRQGTGQNGGTPDAASHLAGWERAGQSFKTHQE
ncbi:T-cell leukemia translocation-altered gene protein homolog [Nelusetta ayraudi]|uniref:T-cell leukemia translocation-altered gene protein homolog n=1 Tax=Nelusetta ayraudi TaxID=303726 RepID=UPI003F719A54